MEMKNIKWSLLMAGCLATAGSQWTCAKELSDASIQKNEQALFNRLAAELPKNVGRSHRYTEIDIPEAILRLIGFGDYKAKSLTIKGEASLSYADAVRLWDSDQLYMARK